MQCYVRPNQTRSTDWSMNRKIIRESLEAENTRRFRSLSIWIDMELNHDEMLGAIKNQSRLGRKEKRSIETGSIQRDFGNLEGEKKEGRKKGERKKKKTPRDRHKTYAGLLQTRLPLEALPSTLHSLIPHTRRSPPPTHKSPQEGEREVESIRNEGAGREREMRTDRQTDKERTKDPTIGPEREGRCKCDLTDTRGQSQSLSSPLFAFLPCICRFPLRDK
mmetsp:Transcript_12985/g.25420  ORF Transcript_12985/g.25420 Transcript_12985/m.25420 type:complete len:220 (-) Transcript_12985:1842-2501(-)